MIALQLSAPICEFLRVIMFLELPMFKTQECRFVRMKKHHNVKAANTSRISSLDLTPRREVAGAIVAGTRVWPGRVLRVLLRHQALADQSVLLEKIMMCWRGSL